MNPESLKSEQIDRVEEARKYFCKEVVSQESETPVVVPEVLRSPQPVMREDLSSVSELQEFTKWNLMQSANPGQYKGKIVMLFSYDATIKQCCLTNRKFVAPIPMAFFLEGDRTRPVCPFEACSTGFCVGHI